MSLNYNLGKTISLFINCLNYGVLKAIIVSTIIIILLFILNKESKNIKYILEFINAILIIIIGIYYIKDIIRFNFTNPLNNIYFYFFNSIIYLILVTLVNTKYKKINFIIYGICLINILFSVFMTYYLKNSALIVIGNIYPMIKFGNIIYILYYILCIINYTILTRER